MAEALGQMGQSGADPRELLLPAPVVAGLRALLGERSGLMAGLTSAGKEVGRAQSAATRLDQRLKEAGVAADSGALALLLTRFKQRDPAEALT